MEARNDPPPAYEIEEKQYGFKDVWRRKKGWFWVGALLTFVTIVLVSTLLVFVLPEEYTARVRLEVMRDSQTYEVFSENAVKDDRSSEDHAAFMRNEVLKMTSKETLYNVIEELRLEKVLEEEHSPGGAYEMLLERLEVNSLPGSSMVDIKVHHSDPEEAADLANAVARAYGSNRTMQETLRSTSALDMLNAQETLQEQKVEDSRLRMIELMEKFIIVDLGTESNMVVGSDTVETGAGQSVREMNSEALMAEASTSALRIKVNAVMSRDAQNRMLWFEQQGRLTPYGTSVREEWGKLKLKLAMVAPEDAGAVPGAAAPLQLDELRRQEAVLDKLVAQVEIDHSALLRTELEIAEASLRSLQEIADEQRTQMMDERKSYTQYASARQAYETQSKILHLMREILLKEKVGLSMPKNPIAIYENAEANEQPVAERIETELKTSAVTGALWAIPGGLVFMYLALAFSRPREFEYVYEYVEKNSATEAAEVAVTNDDGSPY